MIIGVAGAALLVPFAAAPPALAAPPPNNDRTNAIRLTLPADRSGTLVDAVPLANDPGSACEASDTAVWYRFTAPSRGAVIIQLDAAGDMDATVDLFRQVRSRLTWLDCTWTDERGIGTVENDELTPGASYAIRIGKQWGSVSDRFDLKVLVPSPPPQPPGRRLPKDGVENSVDRLANPGDAYWKRLRAGRTMRLYLGSDYCTSLGVYAPGTKSFQEDPVKRARCGGYRLFTPRETGRYVFLVTAARSRDIQRYSLRLARARPDDTTPGVFIRNYAKVHGRLNGGIDSVDLYRFDVTRRSTLSLAARGGNVDLRLVRATGRYVASGTPLDLRVRAGRYYVAVNGSGKYTLRRVSRTITHAKVRFDGRARAVIRPGSSAKLALNVRPAVGGPAVITVERRDPIAGWQFLRRFHRTVSDGQARVTFRPPSVGRYRAFGEYLGSRSAAPATADKVAKLVVQKPLED